MLGLMFFGAIALLVWVFVVLTPKKSDGRRRLKPALIIVGIILGYLLANPIGYVDTQIACRKDGGLRGQISQKRDGFFFRQSPGSSKCSTCQFFVIDRRVSYVDYEIYGTPPKYSRVSMGSLGDLQCSPVRHVSGTQVPEGRCLIIARLNEKPSHGYSFSYSWSKSGSLEYVRGKFGSKLSRVALEIRDLSSDRLLLGFTTYGAFNLLDRMFGSTGGPQYQCPRTQMKSEDFLALAFTPSAHIDEE